mmetsp:Transcript_8581/g.25296  ORF Transcript_8581/g.25296 Transcript_8581/m.25296 type:complete len:404 (-) Transcript_8581:513-1724(-)
MRTRAPICCRISIGSIATGTRARASRRSVAHTLICTRPARAHAFRCGARHEYTIDVVHQSMAHCHTLPRRRIHVGVHRVLAHGHVRRIKNGGLIHVVPRVRHSCALRRGRGMRVQVCPEAACLRIHIVHPRRSTGPALAKERLPSARGVDEQAPRRGLAVDGVALLSTHVRVRDQHGAPSPRGKLALKRGGAPIGPKTRVPGEVALRVRVVNVHPQGVQRHAKAVGVGVHGSRVLDAVDAPVRYVKTKCPQGWERRWASESHKAMHCAREVWCAPDHEVHGALLGEEVRRRASLRGCPEVHVRLRTREPESTCDVTSCARRVEDGHRAIEPARGCGLILEHVHVVEAVCGPGGCAGLGRVCAALECEWTPPGWQAVHRTLSVREGDVSTHWSLRAHEALGVHR